MPGGKGTFFEGKKRQIYTFYISNKFLHSAAARSTHNRIQYEHFVYLACMFSSDADRPEKCILF
jgi:hypothetical protein